MRITWPLWECISARSQVKLALYQKRVYGEELSPDSGECDEQSFIESLEEIDKLMKQRPHPEGDGWRG